MEADLVLNYLQDTASQSCKSTEVCRHWRLSVLAMSTRCAGHVWIVDYSQDVSATIVMPVTEFLRSAGAQASWHLCVASATTSMIHVIIVEDKNGVCLSQKEQDRQSLQHDQSSSYLWVTDGIDKASPTWQLKTERTNVARSVLQRWKRKAVWLWCFFLTSTCACRSSR